MDRSIGRSDPVEVPGAAGSHSRPSTDSGFGSYGASSSRNATPAMSTSGAAHSASGSTWSVRSMGTQTSGSDDEDHAIDADADGEDAVFEDQRNDVFRRRSTALPDVVPRTLDQSNRYEHANDTGPRRGRRAHSVTLPLTSNVVRDMGRLLRNVSSDFDNNRPNQECNRRQINMELMQIIFGGWAFPRATVQRPNRLPLMRMRSQSESDAEQPTPTYEHGRL